MPALVAACKDRWYNQTLCRVNDSVVRLGVLQGEYHWHKHDKDDEFFFVLEGRFIIDLEDRSIELGAAGGFRRSARRVATAPARRERAVVLMAETSAIVPTGDPCLERAPEEQVESLVAVVVEAGGDVERTEKRVHAEEHAGILLRVAEARRAAALPDVALLE